MTAAVANAQSSPLYRTKTLAIPVAWENLKRIMQVGGKWGFYPWIFWEAKVMAEWTVLSLRWYTSLCTAVCKNIQNISSNHVQTSQTRDQKSRNHCLVARQCTPQASSGPKMRRATEQRCIPNQFDLGKKKQEQLSGAVLFNEDFQREGHSVIRSCMIMLFTQETRN